MDFVKDAIPPHVLAVGERLMSEAVEPIEGMKAQFAGLNMGRDVKDMGGISIADLGRAIGGTDQNRGPSEGIV